MTYEDVYNKHLATRKLSSPFTVILTDPVECCDLYSVGSIHQVQEDEDGNRWVVGKVDTIPKRFPVITTVSRFEVLDRSGKRCQRCNNLFMITREFTDGWCKRCNKQNPRTNT